MSILWELFELLVSLIQSFLCVGFARLFLGSRNDKKADLLTYVSTGFIFFVFVSVSNYMTHFEGIAVLVFTIPILFYALFFLEGSITKKYLHL